MKEILKNYIDFYKKNLLKKHIIFTVICMIVFFIFVIYDVHEFTKIKDLLIVEKTSYINDLKENFLLCFMIIFAGITPYFFLPVLGVSAMYNVAGSVALAYVFSGSKLWLTIHCIIALIISIAYSLCIATGIKYCVYCSKKFSYSQHTGFKFSDVKKSIYKLRKKEEKVKMIEEKQKEKLKKIENLNVKIPYLNLAISMVISVIILALTSIII